MVYRYSPRSFYSVPEPVVLANIRAGAPVQAPVLLFVEWRRDGNERF